MSVPVTLSELQKMHRMAAALAIDDPVYVPIFERIERELAALNDRDDAISRARAVAALYKAVG